jgi:large subunit ribosomal protein L15
MSLTLHSIAPKKGARAKSFRIGRGHGSGRGKTAGRGTKGQRARSGGRNKLALKGIKQMLLGFPKTRGFQSQHEKTTTLPLVRLASLPEGTVTMDSLKKAGLVSRRATVVKVVGNGTVEKKWTFKGIKASAAAKTAIEKAGGKITA